jgi:hypothetical protein
MRPDGVDGHGQLGGGRLVGVTGSDQLGDAALSLGQRRPAGGRFLGHGPVGAADSGLMHRALNVSPRGPGAHLVVFVPGAIELGQASRALPVGE